MSWHRDCMNPFHIHDYARRPWRARVQKRIVLAAACLILTCVSLAVTMELHQARPAGVEEAEKRDGKWVVVSQHFSFARDK